MSDAGALKTPNDRKRYEIRPEQLPICCPMPDQRLWDSHPRVWLPLGQVERARCPYCSAEFTLVRD